MQTIEERCDTAVRSRQHALLSGQASKHDIEAAFARAGLRPAQPGKLDVPFVEDAYRIRDETHLVEDDETGSADPEFKLIDDAYRVSVPGMYWFPLSISASHGSAERIRRYVKRQGFLAYWPRRVSIELRGQRGRKKKTTVVASVWPRYVLVHMPAKATVLTAMMPWSEYVDILRSVGSPDADAAEAACKVRGKPKQGATLGQPFEAPFGAVRTPEGQYNGVGDWLKNGLGPIHVPDRHVERVIARERAGEFDKTYRRGKKRLSKLPEWCMIGNIIRVTDGPFASFPGSIEEIDEAKERLRVMVDIFGRATPIDLELAQVSELC